MTTFGRVQQRAHVLNFIQHAQRSGHGRNGGGDQFQPCSERLSHARAFAGGHAWSSEHVLLQYTDLEMALTNKMGVRGQSCLPSAVTGHVRGLYNQKFELTRAAKF